MAVTEFEKFRVKEYNGMQFMDLVASTSPVKHQWAVSVNDKQIIERPLTLQTHNKSYKYNREIFMSSFDFNYPLTVPRGVEDSNWWRYEQVHCELTDYKKLREWRDFYFNVSALFDAALKGLI